MALSDYFPLLHAEEGAGRLDHDPHGAQDKVGGGHQDSDLRRLCQRVRKVAAPLKTGHLYPQWICQEKLENIFSLFLFSLPVQYVVIGLHILT
jgi:hypothetical protein